jgi:hypothetical protein
MLCTNIGKYSNSAIRLPGLGAKVFLQFHPDAMSILAPLLVAIFIVVNLARIKYQWLAKKAHNLCAFFW